MCTSVNISLLYFIYKIIQVKIFVLYNMTNQRDVIVTSLNYEKIKKELDDYDGQICKIKEQEKNT